MRVFFSSFSTLALALLSALSLTAALLLSVLCAIIFVAVFLCDCSRCIFQDGHAASPSVLLFVLFPSGRGTLAYSLPLSRVGYPASRWMLPLGFAWRRFLILFEPGGESPSSIQALPTKWSILSLNNPKGQSTAYLGGRLGAGGSEADMEVVRLSVAMWSTSGVSFLFLGARSGFIS